MLWDCHMHTAFSGDSDTPVNLMIQQAMDLGLPGICITDHLDYDYPDEPEMFLLNLSEYVPEILALKKEYSQNFQVLFGIELGLQPHLADRHKEIVSQFPFDFVIGSSHVVHGADPYYPSFYEGRDEDAAYREYFESILENLNSYENFDSYGHIDYVVRYGPNKNTFYTYEKYRDVIDEILKLLIQKNKALEVNTAGFKYGLGHPNPTEDIIRRYRDLGGELLTIGADAHKPEHIAWEFEKLPELLKSCGFSHYTVYKDRTPIFLPL